jgi:plasmid stability protein
VRSSAAAEVLDRFYRFGRIRVVDLNIKDLDDSVGQRLREQAAAAGMSVQQYLRNELTRLAARLSPAELASGREPMSRAEFEAIRRRLREIDAA